MDISDNGEPKDSGEVEIHETLDAPEYTMTSEDLDDKSTYKLEDAQYFGESEEKYHYKKETLPPESQGYPDSIIQYL